ncbi:uncharacterized protein LOC122869402 [Siniperca chuatsi]|uniref:uncharacterized protein LOC122869402 n=1 Tax=Siniperca chuatsi TaxID=119488 RepID=UPI001CE05829|nr:uncharacterized protein LOC122869402 [Siniperca chuatsi]
MKFNPIWRPGGMLVVDRTRGRRRDSRTESWRQDCRTGSQQRDWEPATGLQDWKQATRLQGWKQATGLLDWKPATGLLDWKPASGPLDWKPEAAAIQLGLEETAAAAELGLKEAAAAAELGLSPADLFQDPLEGFRCYLSTHPPPAMPTITSGTSSITLSPQVYSHIIAQLMPVSGSAEDCDKFLSLCSLIVEMNPHRRAIQGGPLNLPVRRTGASLGRRQMVTTWRHSPIFSQSSNTPPEGVWHASQ